MAESCLLREEGDDYTAIEDVLFTEFKVMAF